jgi:hypothetical protein
VNNIESCTTPAIVMGYSLDRQSTNYHSDGKTCSEFFSVIGAHSTHLIFPSSIWRVPFSKTPPFLKFSSCDTRWVVRENKRTQSSGQVFDKAGFNIKKVPVGCSRKLGHV